jgi:DNA polymerase III subunit epsilon
MSDRNTQLRAIYYDTETTGTRPEKDRIVEIAAYDPENNKSFQQLVQPGIPIPEEATAIHGITNEMIANAPSFEQAGRAFIDFCCGPCVLIAHNNDSFDKLFLLHESKRHQIQLPEWPMIDTLKWARKYRPDLPRHNLQFLRQIYGIAENNAHRALDDVRVLCQLFSVMIDDLPLEKVLELLNNPSEALPEVMPFGKHQGKPLHAVPPAYLIWLKQQGALDKPENASLKAALAKIDLLRN